MFPNHLLRYHKLVYDPSFQEHFWVKSPGDPPTFNRHGKPNCIDSPYGPRFAPCTLYGYMSDGSTVEPKPGEARNIARMWRVEDVLEYATTTVFPEDKR